MGRSSEWILPLPAGFKYGDREAIGIMPCHGCDEWMLVRLDAKGKPYASCDKSITLNGCKRQIHMLKEDINSDRSIAALLSRKDDLADLSFDARQFLSRAWDLAPEQLTGTKEDGYGITRSDATGIKEQEPTKAEPESGPGPEPTAGIEQPAANDVAEPDRSGQPVSEAEPSPGPIEGNPDDSGDAESGTLGGFGYSFGG